MSPIRDLVENERPPNETNELRIVDMNEKYAVPLFEALSNETTLEIYTAIQQEPKTASELKDLTETTLQNTHYHLNKLEEAELIEPVETWLSDRGKEMDVYGPTHSPLILSFANEQNTSRVRKRIRNALGLLGVVSFFSLIVEYAMNFFGPTSQWQQVGAGGYNGQGLLTTTFLQYPGLCVFAIGLVGILAYLIYMSSPTVQQFTS